ncbi:MAG: shikimate dehydrogenase [Chitinispirillaceae bacterium]|nr:shikimate dehydrogenase [Chitinispirillaceae bacterium]
MTKETLIRGDTRMACLLGDPVAHSLSPQIHNHAFRTLGLPYVYVPLAVRAEQLHQVIYALRAVGALGANVTLPHKQRAARCCDVLSPLSYRLGAVNTLYFKKNLLHGTTTDPEGFLRALASKGHDARGGHVVILGNGGTARTLAAALAMECIPVTLTMAGRSAERVKALASEIAAAMDFPVQAYGLDDRDLGDAMARCTLLVNCTSAGMHPRTDETPLDKKHFRKGMAVFDTVYNPATTRFLAEAGKAGCTTQNGLRMLLYQALASFKLWTGVDVKEEIFNLEELQKMCSG